MNLLELNEATLVVRVLAALVTLVGLVAAAGTLIVFAMMMVLFSLDSGQTGPEIDAALSIGVKVAGAALVIAVVVPPVLLLLKCPTLYCIIPAGLGFAVAGISTLAVVMFNFR